MTVSAPAAAAATSDRFYAALRRLARFWVWFFFRRVDVRHAERVPATGPVLLCINHPNNLIDSLLVGAVVPRKVHYLATARHIAAVSAKARWQLPIEITRASTSASPAA